MIFLAGNVAKHSSSGLLHMDMDKNCDFSSFWSRVITSKLKIVGFLKLFGSCYVCILANVVGVFMNMKFYDNRAMPHGKYLSCAGIISYMQLTFCSSSMYVNIDFEL